MAEARLQGRSTFAMTAGRQARWATQMACPNEDRLANTGLFFRGQADTNDNSFLASFRAQTMRNWSTQKQARSLS